MSRATLRLDTNELDTLGGELRLVAEEFQHADDTADRVADAAGDPELAEAIRTCAHEWDDKRRRMVNDIATLGEKATAIGATFTELDQNFARTLRGQR